MTRSYTQTVLKQAPSSVSVGICATTELDNTILLADQILRIKDPRMNLTEIIVVTPNHQLAGELAVRDPRLSVVAERTREGKFSALNRIIRHASGDILVLASADIKLTRNTIPRLVKGLMDNQECGLVDSRVELVNGDRLLMDKVSNVIWKIHNAILDELDGDNRLAHAGDLLAVRRNLIDQLPNVINDDAYIAFKIQEKGFRVKRIQDALVWIAGPRNPTDYVIQRSRVLRGHLQLIKHFGKMPNTFEFTVLWKPKQSLSILVMVISRLGPSYLIPFLAACFLEFLSLILASVSSITRRGYRPWRIVQTTKMV